MSSTTEGAHAAGLDWLPDSVRGILLVSADSNGEWGGAAAAEMADMVGRVRPHTLLVNTRSGSLGPDRPLECGTGPGLTDAMLGRHVVRDVAVAPPARSFLFIPAGQASASLSQLIRAAPFRHLIQAATRGGTLLLYALESDVRRTVIARQRVEFADWFDGIVILGELAGSLNLRGGPPVLARVERPPPVPTPAPAGRSSRFARPKGTPAIIADRESRQSPESRLRRLLAAIRNRVMVPGAGGVVAVWIAAAVCVWLIWQTLSGWPAFGEGEPEPVSAGADAAAPEIDAPGSQGQPTTAPAANAGQLGPGDTTTVGTSTRGPGRPAGVEMPYSVLVGSYLTWGDAVARRDELARDDVFTLVAPTIIRGRLYYRVFAGAFQDRDAARGLMRRMVENGQKERDRDWDVRPVRLAFALAAFASEREAIGARDRLHESGLPAYVLSEDSTSASRFWVYSGAFESEAAAAALDSMLAEAGAVRALETRRGQAR